MSLEQLQRDWDSLGRKDPFWAILSCRKKKGNKWQEKEFFSTGISEIKGVMEHLDSVGVVVSRRKALDFGCGAGRLTQALASYFAEVDGVDIAPSMIELANRYNRYNNKCRYHLNNKASLDLFPDDSFDLIYSDFTLQHIEPEFSKLYITEFVRVLAPSGLLIFEIPSHLVNPNSIKQRVKRAIGQNLLGYYRKLKYGSVMHMYSIERQDVVAVLVRSTASIIEVSEYVDDNNQWNICRYFATKP